MGSANACIRGGNTGDCLYSRIPVGKMKSHVTLMSLIKRNEMLKVSPLFLAYLLLFRP
jgi:hypothetical protein